MTVIVYLLKTTIVFVTLFSLYNIFLRNVTFLRLRRWYLNGMLILSFLIPWISPRLLPHHYHPETGSLLAWVDQIIRRIIEINPATGHRSDQVCHWLVITAFGITFILVSAKYAVGYLKLRRFLKKSFVISKDEKYIIRTGHEGDGCFCFLKTIYLHGPSLNDQNIDIILEHEKAHIRQKHYIDMWLSALCDYFFWFYPFSKRFQKAWNEVLECLADREAINALHIAPITYQSALYAGMEFSGMRPILNSAFGRSMIAKRLLFISKKPSCIKRLSYKLALPVLVTCVLTVCLAFADVQILQLQKIYAIRNAGYELDKVATGYVLDSKTEDPVSNAIVKQEGGNAIAVTDADGFFFIEKPQKAVNVRHIAYSAGKANVSDELIIKIEPAVLTVSEQSKQARLLRNWGKVMTEASFSSGKSGYRDYISRNMRYPEEALINKINGTVWVQAEIDAEGEVKNVRLHRGICSVLDREAIRLVESMPRWNPAVQNNVRTKVRVLLPVIF